MHYSDLKKIHATIDESAKYDPLTKAIIKSSTALGHYLWTRTDEILDLRRSWIRFDLSDKHGNKYHEVRLPFRKTNPLDEFGQVYDIYPCPLEPARCGYSALQQMRVAYNTAIGKDYAADELIFPKVANGKVHQNISMKHANFAQMLDVLVDDAGILEGRQGKFEPRSLRRGGGQHDFIHKTLYPRFSLPAAKWWGGWGAGESVDTFIKYLLNELESETSRFGDLHNPQRLHSRHAVQDGNREEIILSSINEIFNILNRRCERTEQRQPTNTGEINNISAHATTTVAFIPNATCVKDVLTQWFRGQPQQGLLLPLKDWDVSMRNGHGIQNPKERKKLQDLYVNRAIIGKECTLLGNENTFVHSYASFTGINKLIAEIRKRQKQRLPP